VTWYILQATHSETALGLLVVVQTIPAMLMLPFTGVIIDRQDRRYLVMILDATRALIILTVAVLVLRHQAQLWMLYLMNVLVAAGFWMFWPTITALIQELTPEAEFIHANTFLLAGVQGGWLIAGALVGFAYNHIGLGGVLLIDCATYGVSFLCYFAVRKGKQLVERPHEITAELKDAESAFGRYWLELREGLHYLRSKPYVVLVGVSWALFLGAMLTQGVLTAPLSDRILHGGAVGYGWLNGGWGVGAFLSAWYAPAVIRALKSRPALGVSMGLLAVSLFLLPYSHWLALAVAMYGLMGTARGIAGISISTTMMELVPKHFMGRVQNTFYFFGTLIQVVMGMAVGVASHRVGLGLGFALVGGLYFIACLTAVWPVAHAVQPEPETAS
jgi:MFS family permease